MRSVSLLPLGLFSIAGIVLAQQSTTYVTDLNGRKVANGSTLTTQSGAATTRSEVIQTINGRTIPLESTEERVIREDAGGRVVERIVRRLDPNGNPGPSEKQQIEERNNADGSVSSTVSIYRGDLSGNMQLAERVRTDAQKSGDTTSATVQVERPGIGGSFEVAERKTRVETRTDSTSSSSLTTFRKDTSGQFVEAARIVSDATVNNGQRVENTAHYELADNGKLRLDSQTVTRARKNSDGTESKEVDVFRSVPGRAESQSKPALQERHIIEQNRSGDQLKEITLIQRPTINDPNRLGAAVKVGERVCSGKDCQ